MKTFIRIILFSLFLTGFGSCQKEMLNGPLENDGVAPGPVTNLRIEERPGGAKIMYDLPSDPDLFYVKAEYTPYPGIQSIAKSSYYVNFLQVDGFGDTLPHQIKLYTVDRSENESKPVTVTISPSLPSFIKVFRSLKMQPDFGGVRVSFKNPDKINAVIIVDAEDQQGNITAADSYYTAADSGSYKIIGYDTTRRNFRIYVWDQGYNRSDTLIIPIEPFHEEELDPSRFSEVHLPGDVEMYAGRPVSNMWDGDLVTNGHTELPAGGPPQWFTFDLGARAQLSRFNIKTYPHPSNYFDAVTMRMYEIWGSNNPNPDGSWDSWTLLVSHECIKPSGLPRGQLSDADIAAAEAGDSGDFPLDIPAVRYIRIKCLYNWSGLDNTNLLISEMKFWGSPQ